MWPLSSAEGSIPLFLFLGALLGAAVGELIYRRLWAGAAVGVGSAALMLGLAAGVFIYLL